MEFLLYSDESGLRNIKSMTKFEFFWLSEYLVGTWLVDLDSSRFIESTISIKRSLYMEWYGKLESHKLSLMLESPVIIKELLILASVSLRYFKAICDKSEYTLIRK